MSTRLGELLRERADRAPSGEVSVGDVRRRAAAHRLRRRSVAVSAGALVLVLSVVTVSQVVGREAGSRPQPSGPTSASPTADAGGVRVPALGRVPRGDDPAVAYGEGLRRLRLPDGRAIAVPGGRDYLTWTPYGSGGALVASGEQGVVRRYDSAARVVPSFAPATSLAVSSDGRRTAWTRDGTVVVGPSSAGSTSTRRSRGVEDVVAFLPDGGLAVNARRTGVLHPDGTTTPVPGLASLLSGNDRTGLVSGFRTSGDYAVVDSASGRTLWRTALLPLRFSPDGRHVAAQPNPTRPTRVEVLDARTGSRVTTVTPPRGYDVRFTAWEDDRTLLMVVENGQQQAIVRVGLDGSVDRATPVTSARRATYVFARQP